MSDLSRSGELVEQIILETRHTVWVALSVRGCGIRTRAMVARHDEDFREARSAGQFATALHQERTYPAVRGCVEK